MGDGPFTRRSGLPLRDDELATVIGPADPQMVGGRRPRLPVDIGGELRNAFALFDHWGIEFKQILAWNKTYPSGIPRMGLGYHFRSNVEYVLFGVRGNLRTREATRSIGKAFEAPVVGEHSEKPEKFYEIVRAASYPAFGELFGRKPRDGFTNLYQEAEQDVTKAAA